MKTLQELHKDITTELREKFSDLSHVGCDNSVPCANTKALLKRFIMNSLHEQLEIIAEFCEKKKEKTGWIPLGKSRDPWNSALSSVQDFIKVNETDE